MFYRIRNCILKIFLTCFLLYLLSLVGSVRDELMSAVLLADVQQVDFLLSLDPELLNSRPPVLVNRKEKDHDRTAIMVCGLDPQISDRALLDMNCAHIARALHQRGARLDHVDRHGWDAVSIASAQGLKFYATYLLENGAIVDRPDKKGQTAVMKAAGQGFAAVFELLLRHNASLALQDEDGRTALHYAIIRALNDTSDGDDFLARVRTAALKQMRRLQNSDGTDVSKIHFYESTRSNLVFPLDAAIDFENRTCLMYAAISNNKRVVQRLLRDDDGNIISDPRKTDAYGVTVISMSSDPAIREVLSETAAALSQREHEQWLRSTHNTLMSPRQAPRNKSKSKKTTASKKQRLKQRQKQKRTPSQRDHPHMAELR